MDKQKAHMRLHAGSGDKESEPLPYGRITYTGSKGRALPSQPETGTPSVIVPRGTAIL